MGQIANPQHPQTRVIERIRIAGHTSASNRTVIKMRTLKIVCVLLCVLSLASALTGIRAIRWSTFGGLDIAKQTGVGATLWALLNALLFASAAYGIHRRIPAVWKLGWAVLIFSCLEFMIRAIGSALILPEGWAACIGIVVGATVVTVYWGRWWNRQRDYFRVVETKNQLTPD